MSHGEHSFRIVVFRRGEWWIAQCLERMIAAQAKTYADVIYEIERTLVGFMVVGDELSRPPFDHLPEAPKKYERLFEEGAPTSFDMKLMPSEGARVPVPHLDVHAHVGELVPA